MPALLTWSADYGARLELIDSPNDWPDELGGTPFTVHGRTTDGDELTLLDAWVTRIALGKGLRRLHSPTAALGALIDADSRWSRAIYSTANLGEWRAETGLSYPRPSRRARHFRVDYRPPRRLEADLPWGALALAGESDTSVAYAPDWQITTRQVLVVNPKRRLPLAEAHRLYAAPLLALTHFVSDRPDSLTREILLDPDSETRIEVWRQGRLVEPRDWRPIGGYLFHTADVPDLRRALRRWWKLHQEVQPALGLFADHIAQERTYSPGRLLTLHTALAAYARVRHRTRDLKKLRGYAGVPNDVTGCTNDALALLGASRHYFAHLIHAGQRYSIKDVEDNVLESTRRASALMQACLLRELGFKKADRERLLREYYASWPIP